MAKSNNIIHVVAYLAVLIHYIWLCYKNELNLYDVLAYIYTLYLIISYCKLKEKQKMYYNGKE